MSTDGRMDFKMWCTVWLYPAIKGVTPWQVLQREDHVHNYRCTEPPEQAKLRRCKVDYRLLKGQGKMRGCGVTAEGTGITSMGLSN